MNAPEVLNEMVDKFNYKVKDEKAFGKIICSAKSSLLMGKFQDESLNGTEKPCIFEIVPKGEYELWVLMRDKKNHMYRNPNFLFFSPSIWEKSNLKKQKKILVFFLLQFWIFFSEKKKAKYENLFFLISEEKNKF